MFPRFKTFLDPIINWNNPYQDNPRKSAGRGSKKSLPYGGKMAKWQFRHDRNLGSGLGAWCYPPNCMTGWGCVTCSSCGNGGYYISNGIYYCNGYCPDLYTCWSDGQCKTC